MNSCAMAFKVSKTSRPVIATASYSVFFEEKEMSRLLGKVFAPKDQNYTWIVRISGRIYAPLRAPCSGDFGQERIGS